MTDTISPLTVDPREYHTRLQCNRENILDSDSFLSKSVLWELRHSSAYRWRYYPKTFTGSEAADWGSVIDCLLTTPDLLGDTVEIHDFDNFRTKAAQQAKADAIAAGKIFWKSSQMDQALRAAEKVQAHKYAGPVIKQSAPQTVVVGTLRDVQCKGLIDFAPDHGDCLVDLKTINELTPEAISKRIDSLGYHVQAAWYLKLWNQMTGENRKRFVFIWQESSPPYEIAVTELPAFDIEAGGEWAAHHIDVLKKCTEKNYWPGHFGGKPAVIGRPGYATFRDEESLEPITPAPAIV